MPWATQVTSHPSHDASMYGGSPSTFVVMMTSSRPRDIWRSRHCPFSSRAQIGVPGFSSIGAR